MASGRVLTGGDEPGSGPGECGEMRAVSWAKPRSGVSLEGRGPSAIWSLLPQGHHLTLVETWGCGDPSCLPEGVWLSPGGLTCLCSPNPLSPAPAWLPIPLRALASFLLPGSDPPCLQHLVEAPLPTGSPLVPPPLPSLNTGADPKAERNEPPLTPLLGLRPQEGRWGGSQGHTARLGTQGSGSHSLRAALAFLTR